MIDQVRIELAYRKYSESTIKTYICCLKVFKQHFKGQSLEMLKEQQIKSYLYQLAKSDFSRSTLNQHINAIKFYYEKVLNRKRNTYELDRPRKASALPEVLSKDEIALLLSKINNLKHRAIVSLIYSGGLRVGELIELKPTDIDSKRMCINIKRGKGCKDRQVPLSPKLLKLLRHYYKIYKPKVFLFNGQTSFQYSSVSIRKIIKRAAGKARIKKNVTTHTLRHSYATHMLESGIDLRYIQMLLGHNNIKTTEIYTHLSRKKFQELKSPIDDIDIL